MPHTLILREVFTTSWNFHAPFQAYLFTARLPWAEGKVGESLRAGAGPFGHVPEPVMGLRYLC